MNADNADFVAYRHNMSIFIPPTLPADLIDQRAGGPESEVPDFPV